MGLENGFASLHIFYHALALTFLWSPKPLNANVIPFKVRRRLTFFRTFAVHKLMGNTDRKAYLALALVCIVWGVSWVGTKEGVRYMPPFQMVGIRQILAGLVYVIYFMIRGANLPRKKEWSMSIFMSCSIFPFWVEYFLDWLHRLHGLMVRSIRKSMLNPSIPIIVLVGKC